MANSAPNYLTMALKKKILNKKLKPVFDKIYYFSLFFIVIPEFLYHPPVG